jgi:hypothetical protein
MRGALRAGPQLAITMNFFRDEGELAAGSIQ